MYSAKSLFLVTLVSLVLAPFATAQPQVTATQYQQVYEVKVKPGHEQTFEDFVKAVKDASNEVGSPLTWVTFMVSVGKTTPTYRVVLPFEKWGDRDHWEGAPTVLAKALGKEEAQRVMNSRAGAVESTMVRIWQHLPDGSSNLSSSDTIANNYAVTIREIRPDRVDEYRALQRKMKMAYEKAGKPWVTRSVQRFGEAPNNTFRRAQAFNNWSEQDDINVLEILQKEFGEDWDVMAESLNEMIVRSERFVSTYRPDLSRPTASSTTN